MPEKDPAYFGATFAERRAARLAAEGKPAAKAIDNETEQAEDKAVGPKKASRKSQPGNS